MTSTIDSQYTMMERAEIEKSQQRKKQALIAAAIISCIIASAVIICTIIAMVVGQTESGLRRKQQRKDLKVACNFLGSYHGLKNCKDTEQFYNDIFGASSTIPSEIGLLTQMTYLDISGEGVHGTIPSTLGALEKLNGLSLKSTQLTGTIPSTLANLRQLSFMDLTGCNTQLTGTIPSSLCSISAITILIDCDYISCSCCVCCNTYNFDDGITWWNCSAY